VFKVGRAADSDGTHLVGEVKLPPAFLVRRFGRHDGGDGCHSSGGWTFVGESGEAFTVYEQDRTTLWHGRGSGAPTVRGFWRRWEPVQLHIGGRGGADWRGFRKWLRAEYRAFVKAQAAEAEPPRRARPGKPAK
jgi:hypothetical protein